MNYLSDYDACGFELDYKTDAVKAKSSAGVRHVLFGDIDPSGVLAQGSVEEVREKTRQLISVWKPWAHFVLKRRLWHTELKGIYETS